MSPSPLGLNWEGLCCGEGPGFGGGLAGGSVPSSRLIGCVASGEVTLALSFLICPLRDGSISQGGLSQDAVSRQAGQGLQAVTEVWPRLLSRVCTSDSAATLLGGCLQGQAPGWFV